MSIDVSTPVYDGPFDLLLQLILQEQVDLYEVHLSQIVDAYLAELALLQSLDLDVATEFLLIAATLVELKTRRLLPNSSDMDLDEEFSLWEERDLLLARLIECKTFKDVARIFSGLAEQADLSFPRTVGPDERFAGLMPDLLEGTSVRRLQSAAIRALSPKPQPIIDLFHVTPIKLTVADAVRELVDELPRVGRITFRRLTADLADRIEVIIRFLAVLELFKQGHVDLDQPERFGDIVVNWCAPAGTSVEQILVDAYEG
ncbi:MAG: segregation and condensation protein A [Ilumatobacteraceae bacterium]